MNNQQPTPPPPPKGLTGRAKQLWHGYAQELHSRGMIEEADFSALERLCRLESEADALTKRIETEGVLVIDKNGDSRRSPAVMALGSLSQIIEALKRNLALGGYYRLRIVGEKKVGREAKRPPSVMDLIPNGRYSRLSEEERAEWHAEMDKRRHNSG